MVRTITHQHPLYYEAILQLRDISLAVVEFAEAEFLRHKIPLAKRVLLPNGYDYYVADSRFTKALGKRLQQQFGGELLVTASLYGQKDGKEIFRLTILFREASFRKGEVVSYKGELYIVQALGKEIVLQPSAGGKKIHLKYKEMARIREQK
jgi:NMD protein affecting ribosome stability and mRNA decay